MMLPTPLHNERPKLLGFLHQFLRLGGRHDLGGVVIGVPGAIAGKFTVSP